MDASGTAGSPVFTSYDATAFTSYHQPSPATMKPMSRICGSPAVGQYTSLRMPWPTVAQTRPEPRPVVTASLGPGAITGLTGIPGVGALDISDLLMGRAMYQCPADALSTDKGTEFRLGVRSGGAASRTAPRSGGDFHEHACCSRAGCCRGVEP